jgi:hypothetical protein
MKKPLIFAILSIAIISWSKIEGVAGMANLELKANEVAIHHSGIELPVERILMIRKNSFYCAIIFTSFWTEKDGKEKYAAYKVYFQEDGTGDFSNKNVALSEGVASEMPLRGPFRPFIYQPGDSYIKCGPFRLTWAYRTFVGFMPPDKELGDFGFELAPTKWTDISQVNVFDPRLKWLRYDENRKRVNIPVDELWDNN